MFRISETTELSMKKTHHNVLQFVYGTRNLWRQGQCSMLGGVGHGVRPRISEENIERVRQAFCRSPMKSIRTASRQLELPPSTVHKVLHKNLRLHANKVQMLQALQPNYIPRRKEFAVNMLQRISEDEAFLKRVRFSNEATFHVSRKLNKHNVRIWGSEHPYVIRELQRDSPKVNVWCGIMCNRINEPFFFHEASITADVYLDLLTEYVAP